MWKVVAKVPKVKWGIYERVLMGTQTSTPPLAQDALVNPIAVVNVHDAHH